MSLSMMMSETCWYKEQVDWKINSMCNSMWVKLIITVVVVSHSNVHRCFGYFHGAYKYV